MDRLESVANSLSQITLYDIKSMYNQAKNVVLNISEMEAKVREATNEDPWGASSTLMQEIAQGTFNFQHFNEIMPCIYARFMEKEARQWRQIYKALQLLEYLVKHGSERVVDDARSHISTLKMLRNFHYIDDKGKDEGVNVRNRARELVELLSDVENIRTERRKAKANRHKYVGTGNDAMSFTSGDNRYGGFGSGSSYGAYGSGNYDRDYGGYSGSGGSGFRDSTGTRRDFEEYTAGDDDSAVRRAGSISHGSTRGGAPSRTSSTNTTTAPPPPPPVSKQPEVDLLGGFDDEPAAPAKPANNKALPALSGTTTAEDDEFAEFQAAPASPAPTNNKFTLLEMLAATSSPASATPARPPMPTATSSFAAQPSMQPRVPLSPTSPPAYGTTSFGMLSPTSNRQSFVASPPLQPQAAQTTKLGTAAPKPAAQTRPAPAKSGSNFEDLWSMSLGSPSASTPGGNKPATGGKSMQDLQKEKTQAGIWGASQKPAAASMGAGFGTFATGQFSANAPKNASASTPAASGDDLLL